MKSNRVTTIIFDLDGTLVDTIGDIAFAMNRVLVEMGLHIHPPEAYKDFVGYGLRRTARNAMAECDVDTDGLEAAGEKLIRYYAEHPVDTTVPYEGIPEMLADLDSAGVKTAILSNKAHSLVEIVVRDILDSFPFAGIQGADNGYPLKPDPASALALAGQLGVQPDEVVFIGDSEVDIKVAREAGMLPAVVAWGFKTPEFLREAGAAIVFQKPGDIVRWMRENGGGEKI